MRTRLLQIKLQQRGECDNASVLVPHVERQGIASPSFLIPPHLPTRCFSLSSTLFILNGWNTVIAYPVRHLNIDTSISKPARHANAIYLFPIFANNGWTRKLGNLTHEVVSCVSVRVLWQFSVGLEWRWSIDFVASYVWARWSVSKGDRSHHLGYTTFAIILRTRWCETQSLPVFLVGRWSMH